MTVLRHRALSNGQPVAGLTATVMAVPSGGEQRAGYRRVKVVTAVSGDDGWLEWQLPAALRAQGDPSYVVTGIEANPVVVTVPTTVSTATVAETRTGTLTTPVAATDLVTEQELSARLAGVTTGLAATPTTDAAKEQFVPARLADAVLRRDFGRRMVAYGDPSGEPDGVPAKLTSGQPVTTFGNAPMRVAGGRYVHTPYAGINSAAYLQAVLGDQVSRAGMDVDFGASGIRNATIALPSSRWDINGLTPAGIHFVTTSVNWHVSAWDNGEDIYAEGTFAEPLTGVVRIEIVLDGDTAYLLLPSGQTIRVTDARIESEVSDVVIWELYEYNGSTDPAAEIVRVWADTVVPFAATTPVEVAELRADAIGPSVYARRAPDPAEQSAIPGYPGIEMVRSPLVVPQNFKMWARFGAFLQPSASTSLLYLCRVTLHGGSGGQDQWVQMVLGPSTVEGMYYAEGLIDLTSSGFGVGDLVDVVFLVWATTAGVSTVLVHGPGGKAATMLLNPVAP